MERKREYMGPKCKQCGEPITNSEKEHQNELCTSCFQENFIAFGINGDDDLTNAF